MLEYSYIHLKIKPIYNSLFEGVWGVLFFLNGFHNTIIDHLTSVHCFVAFSVNI